MNSTDFPKSLQVGDYVLLTLPVLCAILLRSPLASPNHSRRENENLLETTKGNRKRELGFCVVARNINRKWYFSTLGAVFFLFWRFLATWRGKKKKTEATEGTNGFFWENLGPSRQIMRKQNLSSSHLENSFQQVSQNYRRNCEVFYFPL